MVIQTVKQARVKVKDNRTRMSINYQEFKGRQTQLKRLMVETKT